MNKFKSFLNKNVVKVTTAVAVTATSVNAYALDTSAITGKITDGFSAAEVVGIAIIGGFATMFVFKLIKRML